ncbi:MAG: ATP-dependent RecD-like DNA helicase [FCB group bacterium]|nr:ATP-dependent RecD-like DNA helicase [FCB group bacterium]
MNNQNKNTETVSGLIERVTFHSEESGFAVLRVKISGHRELVTVIGTLASVTSGEWLKAQGRWFVDPKFGQQFKAEVLETTQPDTAEGIRRYLGSGLIKGIGPKFAERLVKQFGTKVLDVIERFPRKLLEVDGIGKVRLDRIRKAWTEQKSIREIMIFLHSHGVGTSRAFRIYKTYGDEAIPVIQENPYRLANDIWGVGFKTADDLASSLGIAKESDIRARAGVEYVLSELTNEGHCAYPQNDLIERAAKILEIRSEIVGQAVDHLLEEERLVKRFQNNTDLIYLSALDMSEHYLARNLVELARGKHPCPKIDVSKALEWVEQKLGFKLAVAQREAVEEAIGQKVLIITGGPGVGKTTLVNVIVKIFRAKKLKVMLCAPTGRAAKRMSEATGIEAKTIHRLLEFDPATARFKHNNEKPLKGDIIIVDETSMIDLVLAHQFVRAIPPNAALIIVGDIDQLPSVGPGNVLRDIIQSEVFKVCSLTEIFRQAAESSIITNAHRINSGQFPVWPKNKVDSPQDSDFYFVEADEPEKGVEIIVKMYADRIKQQFGFDPVTDIQVLTPMLRGELGARNLNIVLQKAVNPMGDSIQRYGWIYRVGDKVMQIVNNYDKDVFNGDIGSIVSMDHDERELTIYFDGRSLKYDFDELDELILSYAVTIHKSQGSEYPCVIIPIHTQHYMLLQRNLLYTAVTRGRKLVILVGTKKALHIAVNKTESTRRYTSLKERLQEQLT